ncbi:MAG: hypothetical protein Q9191_000217 [Dirinaria sp. TL-2023a]
MGFGDLVSDAGLTMLNNWVTTRSYIAGFGPSQADVASYKALKGQPDPANYPHAFRWYRHITSYSLEFSSLPGDPSKAYSAYGPEQSEVSINAKDGPKTADDDEEDLFASDDESEDEEAKQKKEANLAAYRKKKEGKEKPAAKSLVTMDVKPWGAWVDAH